MAGEKVSKGFFSRNWSMILIIVSLLILIVVFLIYSGKSAVSPDLRYFPS